MTRLLVSSWFCVSKFAECPCQPDMLLRPQGSSILAEGQQLEHTHGHPSGQKRSSSSGRRKKLFVILQITQGAQGEQSLGLLSRESFPGLLHWQFHGFEERVPGGLRDSENS